MKSLSPIENVEEASTHISDNLDGRAVGISPTDGVYKVICYDVNTTDTNIPTLKDEKQFDTMEEALAFAETWLA